MNIQQHICEIVELIEANKAINDQSALSILEVKG